VRWSRRKWFSFIERCGNVGVSNAVDNVDVFAGVEMMHAQVEFLGRGLSDSGCRKRFSG